MQIDINQIVADINDLILGKYSEASDPTFDIVTDISVKYRLPIERWLWAIVTAEIDDTQYPAS